MKNLAIIFIFLLSIQINSQTSEKLVLKNINPLEYESLLSKNEVSLEMGSRIAFKTKNGTNGIIEVIDINVKSYLKLRVKIGNVIKYRVLRIKRKNPYRIGENRLRAMETIRWGNLDLDTNDGPESKDFNNQPGQDFYIQNFPVSYTLEASATNRIIERIGDSVVPNIDVDPRTGAITIGNNSPRTVKFILKSKNECQFYDINHGRYKVLWGVYVPVIEDRNTLFNPPRKDKIFYMSGVSGYGLGFYETRDKEEINFVEFNNSSKIGKSGVVFKHKGILYHLSDKDYSNSSLNQYAIDQECDSKQLTYPEGVFTVDVSNLNPVHESFRRRYIREIKIEHQDNNICYMIGRFGDNVVVGKGRFNRNQKEIKFKIGNVPWFKKSLGLINTDFTINIKTLNSLSNSINSTSRLYDLNNSYTFKRTGNLCGWVEMHAHPMSHLGFGRKVFYGVPDTDLTLPSGYYECNDTQNSFDFVQQGLGNCNSMHGGLDIWPFDDCRDEIRKQVIGAADEKFEHKNDEDHIGAPTYPSWPTRTSVLHQQMYISWLKRAHQGGLRVMVALSVNNLLLAKLANGETPYDDQSVSNAQTLEMIRMVNKDRNQEWMEIAKSSEDLKRIIEQDKLAIILGVEIDQIGNWGVNNPPSKDQVVSEIERLYDQGIRYVFPVHLVDNAFAGAAVYEPLFNAANIHYNGRPFDLETNSNVTYDLSSFDDINKIEDFRYIAGPTVGSQIGGTLGFGLSATGAIVPGLATVVTKVAPLVVVLGIVLDIVEGDRLKALDNIGDNLGTNYSNIPAGHGNSRGLTEIGKFAIKEMMKKGMMIDIDHMSEKSLNELEEFINTDIQVSYPLNAGHNSVRVPIEVADSLKLAGNDFRSRERFILEEQLRNLVFSSSGLLGMAIEDVTPTQFIGNYKRNFNVVGRDNNIAFGSDVNGFGRLPNHENGEYPANWYNRNYIKPSTNGHRYWDYTKEGVAHYGLMYDFLFEVGLKDKTVFDNMFKSSEGFYQMWLNCEQRSRIID